MNQMNYDGDDELERMRQRRQMRREGRQDPDRFGYEDSRYGEGSYERGSRTRREAETEPPRTARAERGTERGRRQAARPSVPATAALRTAIKAVREEIREEAVAAASRWIGERRFSSSWEA